MADVLRIKRRAVGGAAGPPPSLAAAEIAFNEQDNTLYYGKGNSGGVATSIIPIAGAPYAPLLSPAFLGVPTTATTPTAGDNTTKLATTAFVTTAAASYLPLTGGTLSGNLAVYANTNTLILSSATAGQQSNVLFQNAGASMWQMGKQTDNSFFLYDVANALAPFTVTTSGTTTLGESQQITVTKIGGVGIKNLTPQVDLHIGTTLGTARIYKNYTGPTDGTWAYLGDWGGTTNIVRYGSDKAGATGISTSVSVLTSGIEALRINTAQEFGFNLGAINPTYMYDFGGTTIGSRVFNFMTNQNNSGSGATQYLYLGPVVTTTNVSSLNSLNGINLDLYVSGTTPIVSAVNGVSSSIILNDTFTGTVTSGRSFLATQTPNNRPGAMLTYNAFLVGTISNGNGLTTGNVTNRIFSANNAITAATGAGTGTITNQVLYITLPNGSIVGGTTNNYGIYITGDGGAIAGGNGSNYAIWNNSTAPVYLSAGNVGIQNTTPMVNLHVGTIGGTARVYNSFTDGGNGEWAYLGDWFGNVARYGTDYNGSFSTFPRDVSFVRHGAEQLRLTSDGPTFGAGVVVSQPVPVLLGSAALAANSRNVVVMGNFAYTTNQAATPTHTLEIWDITTATPVKVGGLDLLTQGLGQMAIAGHILYIPINSNTNGLQIVDVSNPKAPLLLRNQTSVTVTCAALSGGYLYVGHGNGAFRCYDVSDPSLPIIKSTTLVLSGSTGVIAMALQGKYAYCVGTQTTVGVAGFWILDISDPASITTVATYNTPSAARGIAISGKYAFISGAVGVTGLEVVDISDPSAPAPVTIFNVGAIAAQYVNPIIVGKYLYYTGNTSIRIVDISDPAAPTLIGSITVTANANGTALSGNRLYVTGAPGNLSVYETYGINTPTLKSGSLNTDRLYVDGDSYFAGDMYAQRGLMVGTAGIFSRGPIISDTSLGAIPISAILGKGLVCIGGSDNTFPALKRSTTELQTRLGDDTAFAPLAASVMTQAANEQGARIEFRSLTELTTIAAAATTNTTIQIPANAVVLAVSSRVVTVIPTAATYSIGVAGTAGRYAAGVSTAATTTNPGTLAGPLYYAAATNILITPASTPATATGQLRVVIHYYLVTPPTS